MILPCRIRGCRNHVPPLRFALLFAACLLAPIGEAMAQYGAGCQERVLAVEGERVLAVVVVEGATFRLKSQPVWTSVMITTFSGAMPPRAEAAKAHFR